MASSPNPTRDVAAQEFWLNHLGQANALNRWVVSEFADVLGQRILEVGCGTGNFTCLLAETGAKVLGIDTEEAFVTTARTATEAYPNARVEVGDVLESRWSSCFDTVVVLDVVEHIADDVGALRCMTRALVAGGRLIAKVPAMPSLYGPMDEVVGYYRRYTRRTLADALSAAGLINVRVWAFNAAGVLGWWLNSKILRRRVPPAAQLRSFNRLVPVLRLADRMSPAGFGLSLFAVGERSQSQPPTTLADLRPEAPHEGD